VASTFALRQNVSYWFGVDLQMLTETLTKGDLVGLK